MKRSSYNQYQAYQAASQTVDSGAQLVMLYDGAMKFMKQGLEAIQAKKYTESFNFIDTACAIVNGLAASIDSSVNNKIATALEEYYHSLDIRIVLFQHNHDMEMYDQIMEDLKSMRDTWQGIVVAKT